MEIDGFGNIPHGDNKRVVAYYTESIEDEGNYIDILFNLGHGVQEYFGKRIEEILYNPVYMAKIVLDCIFSEKNELNTKLLNIIEKFDLSLNAHNLTLREVEFYCHEKYKYLFTFTSNLYDKVAVKIITDLDLNPLEVQEISRGMDYYIECYHDFKFYNLRFIKDLNYINELKMSILWIEKLINKKAPRLNEYIKVLEEYEKTIPGIIQEEQLKISIAYYELEGLRIVYEAFKDRDDDLSEKIKNIIKGVAFKYKQNTINDDKCREFLYELKVSAYFLHSKYNIDVSKRADIIIDGNIFVECKKITSEKKFIDRVKEALIQIEKKEKIRSGIIYIDITDAIPELNDIFLIINNKSINHLYLKYTNPEVKLEDELRFTFFNRLDEYSISFIKRNERKLYKMIGDSILVLNVEVPVLHLSPLHERMGIIKITYIISNRVDLKYNYIIENSLRSLSELYPYTKEN